MKINRYPKLFGGISIQYNVPRFIEARRCKADLEELRTTAGEILLLARDAW
jgi:hypothetical protein